MNKLTKESTQLKLLLQKNIENILTKINKNEKIDIEELVSVFDEIVDQTEKYNQIINSWYDPKHRSDVDLLFQALADEQRFSEKAMDYALVSFDPKEISQSERTNTNYGSEPANSEHANSEHANSEHANSEHASSEHTSSEHTVLTEIGINSTNESILPNTVIETVEAIPFTVVQAVTAITESSGVSDPTNLPDQNVVQVKSEPVIEIVPESLESNGHITIL